MVKIGLISDSHGSFSHVKFFIEELEKRGVDFIIHLGDILYHGPRNPQPDGYNPQELFEYLKKVNNLILIRGNCDADVDEMVLERHLPKTLLLSVEGKKIFLAHEPDFKNEAAKLGANIFIHGHTHVKKNEEEDGILVINPGSVSLPKDNSFSAAILNIDSKGVNVTFLEK